MILTNKLTERHQGQCYKIPVIKHPIELSYMPRDRPERDSAGDPAL